MSATTARLPDRLTARRADLILALASLVWGVSFVVVKAALAASTPLAFTALRFAIATLALAPFARLGSPFAPPELKAGALLGGLLAVGFAVQAVGLVFTTPARSAFIVASSSVLAPVVAFVAVRERPRPWVIAALGLAGAGIYFLAAPGAGALNRGDLWTLVTALCFAGQIVAVTELAPGHDPVRLVWMQTLGTALGAGVAAALFEDVRVGWSPALLGELGYAAVFATALALLWQIRAQRHMSSARAGLLLCLEPVFAALASWAWFGERLSPLQWMGGGMILAGMVLAEIPRSERSHAPGV